MTANRSRSGLGDLTAAILAIAGLAMADAANAQEQLASEEELLAHLHGCWKINSLSLEGGFIRMCFDLDGEVELMTYNQLFREAFVEGAKYWLQDDQIHIDPFSIELGPSFSSPHVTCDASVRPRTELRLRNCGHERPVGAQGAFSGAPWAYDGEFTDG